MVYESLAFFLEVFVNASPKLAVSCDVHPLKFCLFLLSNPEANRVAKLLLRSFTSVSVRVGVTSKNLQTSLRSRLERKI